MCELAWLPHLLSLSSQDKAENQGWIRRLEEVSDECSSGVVRVVPSPYLMCVLCVQRIADRRRQLESPSSITDEWRRDLQDEVQSSELSIQFYKDSIADDEKKIEEHEAAIASKMEQQGEPSMLPCQPLPGLPVAMPTKYFCQAAAVSMPTQLPCQLCCHG